MGRGAGRLRVAIRHADRNHLVQPEDVAEVPGQRTEHRQLGGARIAEDRGHAVLSEQL